MKDKEKQNISMKEILTKISFEPITNCNCKVESRIDYKEKQIEEINDIISEEYNNGNDNWYSVAERVYDKIFPEDSVVLSREEYEKLTAPRYIIKPKQLRKEELDKHLKNSTWGIIDNDTIEIIPIPNEKEIRKETLKQFTEKLIEKFYYVFGNEYEQSVSGFDTKVLIEHIDETLKEFINE